MASPVIENIVEAYLDNDDSADITNPIHSTEVAKSYGFAGPLVGGVTVWGWATDTILEALGEVWLDNGWAEYSFRQPTFPGDRLTVRASQDEETGSASWKVEMINQDDEVCVVGRVGSGMSDWSSELVRPASMRPIDEVHPKGPLTLENAEAGKDWAAMSLELSHEALWEFITNKQRTDAPLFTGENPIAHPSWIAGWAEKLLRHNFAIPTSMHTRSRVQHHRRLPVGSTVTGGAHLIQAYERKAHHFANFDVLLQDEQGIDIAQLRHWTIFKIATVEEREALGRLA